jgi:acetyl-CoA carboxylase carboxyl transferase subunit beta
MGSVVGEKIALAGELALRRRVPLITCSSSGGARMQEGALSLLQMAKTADTMRQLAAGGVPHISVLADPVYGGVMASFASLADVILAEPGARAGFAGPRVIAQTIRQELPAGFQSAEFLLRQGHIDAVLPRFELGAVLERLVAFHTRAERGTVADQRPGPRSPVDDVVELRGDRWSEDDPAIYGGLALLDGTPVVVVANRKGRGTQDAISRNFGMPHPSGYRKARRLMEYAERFGVPLVTLVDTPGAYPGVLAEEGNQSGAIAANLAVLSGLRTPVVAVVVGEGGSGGALALAVSDRLLMLANATLSVISPEGAAAILFGDPGRASTIARALRLTAPDLMELGIVDEIVREPAGGAHTDPEATIAAVRAAIARQVAELSALPVEDLLRGRHLRLRAFGCLDRRTPR